ATEHFRDVLLLRFSAGHITITPLPSLPTPCAFMSGALVDHTIYIASGIETPAATRCLHTFWSLNLTLPDAGWQSLPPCPPPPPILPPLPPRGRAPPPRPGPPPIPPPPPAPLPPPPPPTETPPANTFEMPGATPPPPAGSVSPTSRARPSPPLPPPR